MTVTLFVYVTDRFNDMNELEDKLLARIRFIMEEFEALECTIVYPASCKFGFNIHEIAKKYEVSSHAIFVKPGESLFKQFIAKGYVKCSRADYVVFSNPGEYHIKTNLADELFRQGHKVLYDSARTLK